MYEPSFRVRRRASLLVTATALSVLASFAWILLGGLAAASRLTGYTLLATIVLLMLIGARRRLPVIPIGKMSSWMQFHLYLGLFSLGVYCLHVPRLLGSGLLEGGLSALFLLVTISGLYGIYVSRVLPKRLSRVEVESRFDRVRWHRDWLAAKAQELSGEMTEASATLLGRYYDQTLRTYFHSRPSLAYVVSPSGTRRRRLLSGLNDLDRYLEEDGRALSRRFADLVRRRDDLDCQFALQLRLRLWLVLHGALSMALLVGGVVHAFLV